MTFKGHFITLFTFWSQVRQRQWKDSVIFPMGAVKGIELGHLKTWKQCCLVLLFSFLSVFFLALKHYFLYYSPAFFHVLWEGCGRWFQAQFPWFPHLKTNHFYSLKYCLRIPKRGLQVMWLRMGQWGDGGRQNTDMASGTHSKRHLYRIPAK